MDWCHLEHVWVFPEKKMLVRLNKKIVVFLVFKPSLIFGCWSSTLLWLLLDIYMYVYAFWGLSALEKPSRAANSSFSNVSEEVNFTSAIKEIKSLRTHPDLGGRWPETQLIFFSLKANAAQNTSFIVSVREESFRTAMTDIFKKWQMK